MDKSKHCSFENCKHKLPLTAYACKCKLFYCNKHKFSEDHKCSYNYFKESQKALKENLSSIIYTKKEIFINESI